MTMNANHNQLDQHSDRELLAAWVTKQCGKSFTALVRRYAPLVHGTARRMLDQASQQDDVAQLTFIELAKKAPQLLKYRSLGGWLHRTACQKVMNMNRGERRSRKREQEFHFERQVVGEPGKCWESLAPQIDRELGQLSKMEQEVILQRYIMGLSSIELAKHFELSEAAATKRLSRAMEKLRVRFAKRAPGLSTPALSAAFLFHANSEAEAIALGSVTLPEGRVEGWSQMAMKVGKGAGLSPGAIWLAKVVAGVVSVGLVAAGGYALVGQNDLRKRPMVEDGTREPAKQLVNQLRGVPVGGNAKGRENKLKLEIDAEGNYHCSAIGRVVDLRSLQPIEGVKVTFLGFPDHFGFTAGEAMTGEDGKFQLEARWVKKRRVKRIGFELKAENYSEKLGSMNGIETSSSRWVHALDDPSLKIGEEGEILANFQLVETRTLKGRLIPSGGETLTDYSVQLWSDTGRMAEKQVEDDGSFELKGCPSYHPRGVEAMYIVVQLREPCFCVLKESFLPGDVESGVLEIFQCFQRSREWLSTLKGSEKVTRRLRLRGFIKTVV